MVGKVESAVSFPGDCAGAASRRYGIRGHVAGSRRDNHSWIRIDFDIHGAIPLADRLLGLGDGANPRSRDRRRLSDIRRKEPLAEERLYANGHWRTAGARSVRS